MSVDTARLTRPDETPDEPDEPDESIDSRFAVLAVLRIDGKPAGKARHRAAIRGGRVVTYNPATGAASTWLDVVLWSVRTNRPAACPVDGPVRVDLELHLPRPKRLMRKTDPAGPMFACCKPDRDNADKLVLDAMTQAGWWQDDCQVVDGRIRKFYHAKGEIPHAVVTVARPSRANPEAPRVGPEMTISVEAKDYLVARMWASSEGIFAEVVGTDGTVPPFYVTKRAGVWVWAHRAVAP